MRIVHLTTGHGPDDIRIAQKECATLADTGHDVLYCVPGARSEFRNGIQIVAVRAAGNRRQRFGRLPWWLFRAAITLQPDAVHLHEPELLLLAPLFRLRGVRVVFDAHEDFVALAGSRPWIPRGLRWVVRFAVQLLYATARWSVDRFVAATPAIAERFPEHKTALVQNFPILDELYVPAAGSEPLPPRSPRFAYVGRLSQPRGIHVMAEAIRLLRRDHPGATLALAGDFADPADRQAVANIPGVDVLGFLDRAHVADLLADSLAGLLLYQPDPNHTAAQPNKLFEYMSAALPVVASDFPLWRTLLQREACGVVADPCDPTAVAAAMRQLSDDRQSAAQMGQNGRQAVAERYHWKAEAETLLALYRDLDKR